MTNKDALARPMNHRAGPDCPYCDRPSVVVLQRGRVLWICRPCAAWVGVHDSSSLKPLGTLANAELRKLRCQAHEVFDPLWKAKEIKTGCRRSEARRKAYKWLASQLGVKAADCHIGMFSPAQCREVVRVCVPYVNAARDIIGQNVQAKTTKEA